MLIKRERATIETGWEKPFGMPDLLYRLLKKRGIQSVEEARSFLKPESQPLTDPEEIPNLHEACEKIRKTVMAGYRICVYGDYDVDGVCSSVIMIRAIQYLGGDVISYIPSRHEEGYGLNRDAIKKLSSEGIKLLITVDCGIAEKENVLYAESLDMDVIVTDHHRASDATMPDCLVVSSGSCAFPLNSLCGAGVAFKIACSLHPDCAQSMIDIAALATVADVVPMVGENRIITSKGIKKIKNDPSIGLKALMDVAGISQSDVTEETLGFQLGPRVNAAGRIKSARIAFDLLMSDNIMDASAIARELNAVNTYRSSEEALIFAQAEEQLDNYDFTKRKAIVLYSEGWNPGVIGIAASKLMEKYHFPVILFSITEGVLKGSCRSIEGIDIYLALKECSSFIEKFGGHKAAAGLTVKLENLNDFCCALDEYLEMNIPGHVYIPVIEYDTEASVSELNIQTALLMEKMRPFGPSNEPPVIFSEFIPADLKKIGKDQNHLKLSMTDENGNRVNALWFGHGKDINLFSGHACMIGNLSVNRFNGSISAQMQIRYLLPPNDPFETNEKTVGEAAHAFLTDIMYTELHPRNIRVISCSTAIEMIRDNIQGVVCVFASLSSAKVFYDMLDCEIVPDVVIGKWTQDDRSFTAVSVCPTGEIPVGVHTVISFDIDISFLKIKTGVQLINVSDFEHNDWKNDIPNVNDLRNVYIGLRDISSRPFYKKEVADYYSALSAEYNISYACAALSCEILSHINLIRIDPASETIELIYPALKADPEEEPLYRKLLDVKEGRLCE